MKALILVCIFILSCRPEVKQESELKAIPKILTEKQALSLRSMNERENAFMEDCLNECYKTSCMSFRSCLVKMSEQLGCVSTTRTNNHMLDTAIGTAIGHGASKLLLEK